MKTKGSWVIKTSSGTYWCGNNHFDEQIRKAQIYHWKEAAEEQAAYIWRRNKLIPDEASWEIVEVVEPKELKDTEAEWIRKTNSYTEDTYFVCSECSYSALNDYRGRSTDSKFCPHCGKRMINSTMPED